MHSGSPCVNRTPLSRIKSAVDAAAFSLFLFVNALLIAELLLRLFVPPTGDFARFTFQTVMSVERWNFLNQNRERLEPLWAMHYPPHMDAIQGGDKTRPPFDRIEAYYRVRTNGDGFRSVPFTRTKAPGVRRILILGDSISFGQGLDAPSRYADRLERLLNRTAKTEIYDLGVPSCTTPCMEKNFERYVDYKPDLVIMQISANDIDLTLWRVGVLASRDSHLLAGLTAISKSRLLMLGAWLLSGDLYRRQWAEAMRMVDSTFAGPAGRILGICRERGIPVVMVATPFADGQDYSANAERLCHHTPDVCKSFIRADFDHPSRWIPDWPSTARRLASDDDWAEKTRRLIGIREDVVRTVFPYRFLYTDIVHPNRYGHEIVAGQLYRYLKAAPLPTVGEPRRGR